MEFCQSEKVGTLLWFIHIERMRAQKPIFYLIFVAAQCKHSIKFSVNPSGIDIAFAFDTI